MNPAAAFPSIVQALAKPLFESPSNATADFEDLDTASGFSVLFNTLLLTFVPLCVQLVLYPSHLKTLGVTLEGALVGGKTSDDVLREIKAITRYDQYYVLDSHANRHGHILQKAIAAHLAEVLQLRGKGVRYEMVERELDDETQEELNMVSKKRTPDYWSDDDDDADMYEELNRLKIASLPKFNTWVEVEKGIYFQQYLENPDGEGGGDRGRDTVVKQTKEVVMVYAFKSRERGASARIDKFINDAFAKYQLLELLKLANDKKRYMYVQAVQEAAKPSGNSEGEENSGKKATPAVVYKRYALSGEKSFKNLFFDEKPQLLQLLDSFMARSGKFAIKGFPYKLGLLLHGPPGTGKTSLIKAVAQYTKRHIVTISLGKVKTNQELMNALFDLRFAVEGVDLPVNMTFEDVVFVMEDIDCAASVVMARENKPEASRRQRKRLSSSSSASDKLNLSGLLNVLDGVIDCPGRIVIMTTNHPEKLDPALIRPGRVNKKLMLGYMNSAQVQNMIEYYFATTCTRMQREALQGVTGSATPVTPAAVEALCSEHDDVDAVVEAFRRTHQISPPCTIAA
ncbi:mitochondrial chaperone BCS1-B [Phytophthora cinnamomi]|uniref:mitochondrial chaperone BCS1-B n=1 Tax=Phytophthora cinnamomi TaxID=4785 RepID=UPI0035596E4E|nr:mitochondrial chaperone BCS1-B [Phytophthora cinnamomi]